MTTTDAALGVPVLDDGRWRVRFERSLRHPPPIARTLSQPSNRRRVSKKTAIASGSAPRRGANVVRGASPGNSPGRAAV